MISLNFGPSKFSKSIFWPISKTKNFDFDLWSNLDLQNCPNLGFFEIWYLFMIQRKIALNTLIRKAQWYETEKMVTHEGFSKIHRKFEVSIDR